MVQKVGQELLWHSAPGSHATEPVQEAAMVNGIRCHREGRKQVALLLFRSLKIIYLGGGGKQGQLLYHDHPWK